MDNKMDDKMDDKMDNKIIATLWEIAERLDRFDYVHSIESMDNGITIKYRDGSKQQIPFPKNDKTFNKDEIKSIVNDLIRKNIAVAIEELKNELFAVIEKLQTHSDTNLEQELAKLQETIAANIKSKISQLQKQLEEFTKSLIPQVKQSMPSTRSKDGMDADEQQILKRLEKQLTIKLKEQRCDIESSLEQKLNGKLGGKLEAAILNIKEQIPTAINGIDGQDGRDADAESIKQNLKAEIDAQINDLRDSIKQELQSRLEQIEADQSELHKGVDVQNGKDGKDGKDGQNGRDANEELIKNICIEFIENKIMQLERNLKNLLSHYVSTLVSNIKPITGKEGKQGIKGDKGDQGNPGERGEKGDRGNSIKSAKIDNDGHLIIKTDEHKIDAGKISIQQFYGGGGGSGSGGISSYTNTLPMPFEVGGFKEGTKFKDISMNALITKLLYGYDLPYFDVFYIDGVFNDVEVGFTLLAGNYDFYFNIVNTQLFAENSIEINKNKDTLLDSLPNISPVTIALGGATFEIPHTINFEVLGYDTTGASFNKYFPISWKHKIYYGEYTEDIDDNNLPNPLSVLRATELVDNIYAEYYFQGVGYKWFCYPEALGESYVLYDLNSDITLVLDEVRKIDVLNDYGLTITYNCYRTLNEIHNDFIMVVKNG